VGARERGTHGGLQVELRRHTQSVQHRRGPIARQRRHPPVEQRQLAHLQYNIIQSNRDFSKLTSQKNQKSLRNAFRENPNFYVVFGIDLSTGFKSKLLLIQ
jgi:hypothetical protein